MKSFLIRVLKEAGIYSLSPFFQQGISFLLLPLYTAYLTPAEYGNWTYIVTIVSVIMAIASGGLQTSFFKYGSTESMPKRGEVLFSCLLGSCLLSATIFLLSISLGSIFFKGPLLFKCFIIYLLGMMLRTQFNYVLLVLRYTHRPKMYVAISAITGVFLGGANIVFVAYCKLGIYGIAFGALVASLSSVILFMPVLIKEIRIRFSLNVLKKLFRFGLPIIPGNIAALIMTMSDRIFLQHYRSPAELGLYGYGYKFGMAVNAFVIAPFFLAWTPYIWEIYKERSDAKKIYAQAFEYFTAGLLVLTLASSVILTFLGTVMASNSEFTQGLIIVPLILASYFLVALSTFVGMGIFFENKTHLASVSFICAAGLNLILNFLLIPSYGMIGAAIATIASYGALFVLYYLMNQYYYHIAFNLKHLTINILYLLAVSSCLPFMYHLSIGAFYSISSLCLVLVLLFYIKRYNKELSLLITLVRNKIIRGKE